MKNIIFLILMLLLSVCSFSYAQIINDYQSIMNTHGDWNNISIWQRWNGSAWVAATVPPPDGINVAIASNAVITISSDVTYSNLTFVPYPGSGTITLNAKFTIAGIVNINNSIGSAGAIFNGGTGSIIVNSGSTFNINFGDGGEYDYPSVVNNGTININSGTDLTYGLVFAGRFSCAGNINCLSKMVSLKPPGSTNDTISGNVSVSAGAIFALGGSNLGNTIVVSGNISGAGTTYLGATAGRSGNVFFNPSSVYNITGTTYLFGGTETFSTGMTLSSFGKLISKGGAETTFQSGVVLPANLKLTVNYGIVTFNTSCSFLSIELNGGSYSKITANKTIYVTDSLIFGSSAYITAGTDSVVVQPSGIIKGLGTINGKIINNGTAYISGTTQSSGGSFINNGTTYISNNTNDFWCTFTNRGTLTQNLPIAFRFQNTFTNSGTINVPNGTLNCNNIENSGIINISSGATIGGTIQNFAPTLLNNGTILGNLNIKNNCTLNGNGVIYSVYVFNNDTLTLGSNHQFQTLTINSGGTFKLNGKTLSLNGATRPIDVQYPLGKFDASSGTVRYNGTTNQYTGGSSYLGLPSTVKSLIIANTSTVTMDNAVTVSDTLYLSSGTLNVTGTLTASNIQYLGGSISPVPSSGNTITVNSASATIPATVNNLLITNPAGCTVNNNVLVNTSLDLSGGALTTGSYTITLGSGASVTETNSNYLKGNLSLNRTVSAGQSQSFGNIGFSLGSGSNNLGTVSVTRSAGTAGSIITSNGNSGIKRKWTISATNPPASGRTLTMSWTSADDNGIVWSPSRRAIVYKSTDGGTTYFQVGNPVDVSVSNPRTISVNVNSFSIYTIGAEDAPLMSDSYINITAIPYGFYDAGTGMMAMKDTVKAYIALNSSPFAIIDSAKAVIDSITFTGQFKFNTAPTGKYYIILKHRNSIDTWSMSGGTAFTKGTIMNYDFTTSQGQAFGNNLVQVGTRWCIINGDCNGDGYIDGSDYLEVINHYDESGYLTGDNNGDGYIDGSDYLSIINNYDNGAITPLTPSKMIQKMKKDNLKNRKVFQEIKKKINDSGVK